MNQLMESIDKSISMHCEQIGKKASIISFLDNLKFILVDEIKKIEIPSYSENEEQEFNKNFGDNDLSVICKYYSDQLSKIKSPITKDYLSIVVSGQKSIRVFDNQSTTISSSLNLFKNMGLVLPKNTIISELISKETFIIDVISNNKNIDIEK